MADSFEAAFPQRPSLIYSSERVINTFLIAQPTMFWNPYKFNVLNALRLSVNDSRADVLAGEVNNNGLAVNNLQSEQINDDAVCSHSSHPVPQHDTSCLSIQKVSKVVITLCQNSLITNPECEHVRGGVLDTMDEALWSDMHNCESPFSIKY